MEKTDIFSLMHEALTRSGMPEVHCITEEEKWEKFHPVHRHDGFEIRMLLAAGDTGVDSIDITPPRVCHRALAPDENMRSHTLQTDGISTFCRHRASEPQMRCDSPYRDELVRCMQSLVREPDSSILKEEFLLLLALFYLRAACEEGIRNIGERIQDFAQYLERSYYRHDLSIGESAGRFGISPGYIQQVFRNRYSCNPKEYLLQIRMENAAKLLQERRYCIYEVASLCGFSDAHYFSGVFRRYYGESPRAYSSKSSLE